MADEEPGRQGERYTVTSPSLFSARADPHVLSLRHNDDGSLTRRVIEPTVVANRKNPEASVELTIAHQRRRTAGGDWTDEPAFNLATLRAGEEVRLVLRSEETLALYQHLQRLFEIGEQGVQRGEHVITVVDEKEATILRGSAKEIVQKLIDTNGPDIFSIIDSIEPDLLTAAAVGRTHAARRAALATFEGQIGGAWSERDWQAFFEANPWIFGHGLDYRFLVTAQAQPNLSGGNVEGIGGERGDFLMNTEGDARFAVLVEIKKPKTPLLAKERYRNGAWLIGPELAGGVARVQANCHHWETEGARLRANERWLEERGIRVVEPKGILLIGDLAQLDTDEKQETFERFRRNLKNPEVLTYDEVLARARFLVEQAAPTDQAPTASDSDLDYTGLDDLPF